MSDNANERTVTEYGVAVFTADGELWSTTPNSCTTSRAAAERYRDRIAPVLQALPAGAKFVVVSRRVESWEIAQ